MAALYLDSSSVVKRYVAEVGSGWIRSITDTHAGNFCWLSSLARVELLSALYLRVRTGTLSRAHAQSGEYQFRAELPTLYYLVPVRSSLLNQAMALITLHPLRAYDAVQLASALTVQAQCQSSGLIMKFISADKVLNRVAGLVGLTIDDPNQHP